jgi:hypothetical protein
VGSLLHENGCGVYVLNPRLDGLETEVRELKYEEFRLAEKLWEEYRGQKNDMPEERVFAVFENGSLAATARCTRHPDGLEMDSRLCQ